MGAFPDGSIMTFTIVRYIRYLYYYIISCIHLNEDIEQIKHERAYTCMDKAMVISEVLNKYVHHPYRYAIISEKGCFDRFRNPDNPFDQCDTHNMSYVYDSEFIFEILYGDHPIYHHVCGMELNCILIEDLVSETERCIDNAIQSIEYKANMTQW